MQNFLQRDLGSSLLSLAILLGWLGLFSVFLRIFTISIKKILEAIFKKTLRRDERAKTTDKTISRAY